MKGKFSFTAAIGHFKWMTNSLQGRT